MFIQRYPGIHRTASTLALTTSAIVLVAAVTGDAPAAEDEYSFHRDHILGTSFDLKVRGTSRLQAEACERAILAEIERLNKILNSRIPDSEISRLAAGRTRNSFKCSADLYNVMKACNSWRIRTTGAFDANVGELFELWQAAAKSNKLPTAKQLAEATGRLKKASWRLDTRARTVRASSKLHLMTDGLAKGYIIDKALAAGRKQTPQAKGLLVDIGGDIATWSAPGAGDAGKWPVGVADPFRSEDNAPPAATLSLANRSVATSGSYARYFKIGSKRYSRIIDPRSGRPADGVVSATVVADDTVSADALATAMCVLTPYRSVALANRLSNVECLIVDSAGKKHRSRNWSAPESTKSTDRPIPTAGAGSDRWPDGYCVKIGLTLRENPPSRSRKKKKKYHRPYVGVMIADDGGNTVKTLALWVERKTKYDKELKDWYRMGRGYRAKVRRAVSRGTRGPGDYTLLWDGRNDDGKPVKPGNYGLLIEINREGGSHVYMRANINCRTSPASARMEPNNESEGAWAKYGPQK